MSFLSRQVEYGLNGNTELLAKDRFALNIPEWSPLSSNQRTDFIRGYLGPEWQSREVFPSYRSPQLRVQSQPRTTVDIPPHPSAYVMGFCANIGQNAHAENNYIEYSVAQVPQLTQPPQLTAPKQINLEEPKRKKTVYTKKTVCKKRKKPSAKSVKSKGKGKRYELFCGHCEQIFYSKTTFRPKYNHHLVNHRCLNTNVRMQYVVGVRHRRCTARCSPHIGCIRWTSK